jgi:hypothetical protein
MYKYATFAINALFICAIVLKAIRTRFWRGLLQLDYTSIKSVVVSASAGGSGLAPNVLEHWQKTEGHVWLGNSHDPVFSDIDVILIASKSVPDMPALGMHVLYRSKWKMRRPI